MANLIYRNQANKIFIYNSADEVVNDSNLCIDDKLAEPKNTSSITILTSGIPEYHIRIKNNFKTEAVKKNIEDFEHAEEFDLKTNSAEPLVCFKDSKSKTDGFAMNEDVLLRSTDDKLYLGTIVNIQNGKYLVKFDDNTEKWSCERGLKKLNSSLSVNDNEDEPLCVVCKERNETDVVEVCNKCCRGYHRHCIKNNSSNFSSPWCCDRCTASEIISISDSEDNESDVISIKSFPYDVKSLKWDSLHHENKEQVYCYCGKTGTWKVKMLQCCKCQQWFHEKCISSWRGYLAHGDMFFVFCCKICGDNNEESLLRLHLSWKTAVHLVLYELTTIRPQKFYSISKEVAPFLWNNWNQLHLPFAKYHSKEKLVKKLLLTVKQEDEFKSIGGSNKQKSDLVCLRRKVPPKCPKLKIPGEIVVSEKTLKKTFNIKTVPLNVILKQESLENREEELIQKTSVIKAKRGRKSTKQYSDPQPDKSSQSFNDDSSDENSSKSTLDWIIPPPSNFHGRNNPFHSQYRPNGKFKSSEKISKKGQQTVFEKLPEIRIVRTIKRRLSAKDIALGSNREMKRRKVMKRRKSSDIEIISEVLQPVSMPLPSYPPVHNGDKKESNKSFIAQQKCLDEADSISVLQERRQSREIVVGARRNSVKINLEDQSSSNINITEVVINSPVKNKAINMYFGAFNRIESGEKFTILAKRKTFDGKEHYLFDWDTMNNGASSSAKKDSQT